MLIFLNGQFVSEEHAVVSVFDRGFLYGDGLFETMRVFNGKPFRWTQHWERLQRGAEFLKIKVPYSSEALRSFAAELINKNEMPNALLRLTLSRGVGIRGYSPKGADKPTIVMTLHAGPQGGAPVPRWKLAISSQRLVANDPLAQFKTCNKLPQILARAEADAAGADEALLLNTDGFAVEGASSNLFWIKDGAICTPPLAAGILAGVTRAVVFEICEKHELKVIETNISPDDLKRADGIFLALSSLGVIEAVSLDGGSINVSPLSGAIQKGYCELAANSQETVHSGTSVRKFP